MIRIGIVGCNYGRLVHLPAFRNDPRCTVMALAGSDAGRAAELASDAGIPLAFGRWEELVDHPDVDAVTIAAPPRLQPAIAMRALALGKPVFAEKPMAAGVEQAETMARAAATSGVATAVDFNFSAVLAFRKARELLDQDAIGRLRHVTVNWNVENASTRLRLKHWKTTGADGGGALGNFVCHSFHYLEWLCGPVTGLSARLSGLPGGPSMETNAAISLRFASGAAGNLAMSCASYLGSGHRAGVLRRGRHADAGQSDAGLHARLRTACGPAPGDGAGTRQDRRRRGSAIPRRRPDRTGLAPRQCVSRCDRE
jgi:predicted dehydrogenase